MKQVIACCLLSFCLSQTVAFAQQPGDSLLQNTLKAAEQANEASAQATQAGAESAALEAGLAAKKAAEKAAQLRAVQYQFSTQPKDPRSHTFLQIAQKEAQQAIQDSLQATQAALKAAQEAARAAQQAAARAAEQANQAAQIAEQASHQSNALRTIDLLSDALDSYYYFFRKLPDDDATMKRFVQYAYKHVLNLVANPSDVPTTTGRGHAIFHNLEMAYDNRVATLPKDFYGQYILPTDNNWQWEPGTIRMVSDGRNHVIFLSSYTQPRFVTLTGAVGNRYNFAIDLR